MKTSELKKLQKDFLACLSEGRLKNPAVRPGGRMQVYVNAYWIRIEEALAEDFEQVIATIGRAEFSKLVRRYMKEHPSKHWTLSLISQNLPAYLSKDRLSKKFPSLPELAALDWAKTLVHSAEEPQPLPLEVFADEEALNTKRLLLASNAQLLASGLLVFRSMQGVKARNIAKAEFQALQLLNSCRSIAQFLERISASTTPATLQKWISRWARDGVLTVR